ncbi:MAG: gliding motility-associated C-terminal domain-containing protein, partial [Flavobacteriales bacterium]|nr:gliding motility-associated C-terminal domain-containing protein [Flavobacteriales bacterium]
QTITVSPANTTNYSVTVGDQNCTPDGFGMATVTVNQLPIVNFTWACDPDPSTLTFTSTAQPPPGSSLASWNWDFDDGGTSTQENPDHDYLLTQTYNVSLEVLTVEGCSGIETSPVASPPTAEFFMMQNGVVLNPPETSILSPLVDFVDASSPDVVWWLWDFDDGDSVTVQTPDFSGGDGVPHMFTEAGIYNVLLMVRNLSNCYDTVVHPLLIESEFILFTPNSFTPNGDNVNDYFFPRGIGIEDETFTFYIYDRWGDMVYESAGVFKNAIGWDGRANDGRKVSQLDVYVWLIRTEDQNGDAHEYVGHVTLMR